MPCLPDGADEDAAADPIAGIDDRNTADRIYGTADRLLRLPVSDS
jgi:hypothetical protein